MDTKRRTCQIQEFRPKDKETRDRILPKLSKQMAEDTIENCFAWLTLKLREWKSGAISYQEFLKEAERQVKKINDARKTIREAKSKSGGNHGTI